MLLFFFVILLYNINIFIERGRFMKIISINAGSSSLKFSLFDMNDESVLVSGTFERIGSDGSNYTIKLK